MPITPSTFPQGGGLSSPDRVQRRADMMQRRIDRFTDRRDAMLDRVVALGGTPTIDETYTSTYTTVDPSGSVESQSVAPMGKMSSMGLSEQQIAPSTGPVLQTRGVRKPVYKVA